MANEAVQIVAPTKTYSYTVAAGTAITKGALMAITSDPRTVLANAGAGGQVFAGVAVSDKSATDGAITMGLAQDGIYDLLMATGSTCSFGDLLILSGANAVARMRDFSNQAVSSPIYVSAMIVGMALETGSSAETIAVDIGRRR